MVGREPDFGDKYEQVKSLGRGCYGEAMLMRDRTTGLLVAIKYIEKGKVDEYVQKEIRNHVQLTGHPNIIQFKEAFLTATHLGIAMEYANGGDLFDRVVSRRRLPEDEARYFFWQLVQGLAWCHSQGVCHRDLKLDNVLLAGDPSAPQLKLCDFGFSKSQQQDSMPNTLLGTPAYLAPEVLKEGGENQQYNGELADVWSCGVALYVMLVGAYPFQDPADPGNHLKTYRRIFSVQYEVPADVAVSGECLDLIRRILVRDPAQRITLQQVQQHAWYLAHQAGPVPQQQQQERPMQTDEEIMKLTSMAAQMSSGEPGIWNEEDCLVFEGQDSLLGE
ncbi:hypothetical protein CHLNCDRAFT_135543 [Chlorella variabilis]|uniref:Protein kinase domain-containing protein n=1 Tax=Chlorella variabilis TaxID=554065 RepID=E1ZIE9_CHLVA|nr:hypothetical protein CHLNCDRAFT_135543 [Chlorella variabilis]EFN54321.1 hypothetical protein CHLNCDRAFT_135543 [Chlorella variabilis]|eukprot:XP_005846423.1 hypothetical protein CHLNCDRAFT_135543 [Chlorella variabilis]